MSTSSTCNTTSVMSPLVSNRLNTVLSNYLKTRLRANSLLLLLNYSSGAFLRPFIAFFRDVTLSLFLMQNA